MTYRSTCCDSDPIPDSLEKRKSGMWGRCSKCRTFDLLDVIEPDTRSNAELKQEQQDRMGDCRIEGSL
jgi:hypothetical protein